MKYKRPKGWNDKPIPHGMLYSDYTPEEIEKLATSSELRERRDRAVKNMERFGEFIAAKLEMECER